MSCRTCQKVVSTFGFSTGFMFLYLLCCKSEINTKRVYSTRNVPVSTVTSSQWAICSDE
jgi:hypothetical protein